MNTIQTPTKLGFSFGDDQNNSYDIIIEEVGMNIFLVTDSKIQFPCLVEILADGGKRIISFETGIFVSNNTDYNITLNFKDKTKQFESKSYQALPMS